MSTGERIFVLLFVVVLEIYMFQDFLSHILHKKEISRQKTAIVLILLGSAILAVNLVENMWLNTACFPLFCLIASLFLYDAKAIVRILFVLIFYLIFAGIELIAENLFFLVDSGTDVNFIRDLASTMAVVAIENIIAFIILKIVARKLGKSTKVLDQSFNNVFMAFLMFPASSLIVFIGIYFMSIKEQPISAEKILLISGCVTLLIANAFIFYVFEKYVQSTNQANEATLINQRMKMELKHYESLDKQNRANTEFIHNWRNNWGTLLRLADDGGAPDAYELVVQLNDKVGQIESIVYCGDSILNAILCDRRDKCMQLGIRYDVRVTPMFTTDSIGYEDLVVVMGNLLDNAIEASEKCPSERYVKVDLYAINKGAYSVIRVKNRCMPQYIKKDGEDFLTTKKDSQSHGIGLRSVRQIAKKHEAMFEAKAEGEEFCVLIVFPVSNGNICLTEPIKASVK